MNRTRQAGGPGCRLRKGLVIALCSAGGALSAHPAAAQLIQSLNASLVDHCWACEALNDLAGVALDLSQRVFLSALTEMRGLVGLLMAMALLLYGARSLLPFGPDGRPAVVWNQAATKLFHFAVVLTLLQNGDVFWEYIFVPVMASGMGFAARLLAVTGPACPVRIDGSGIDAAKAAMSAMTCPLATIQAVFSKGMIIGLAIMAGAGWHSWLDFLKVWEWAGQLLRVLSGAVLTVIYASCFLVFPLLFIDTLLRAAIVAVMMPFALAASLFSSTRKMTERALWKLGHSTLTMVFACAIISIGTAVLTISYGRISTRGGVAGGDWPTLVAALESGDAMIGLFDSSYWMLVGAGIIVIFMLRRAGWMAAELVGEPGGDFSGATDAAAQAAGAGAWLGGGLLQRVSRAATLPPTDGGNGREQWARPRRRPRG